MASTAIKVGVVVLLVLVVLSGVGVGSYLYIRSEQVAETKEFSNELRDGLVASCERNGNPLREAVRKMLRQDLAQSDPQTIRRYFPQIPLSEIERLIQRQREETLETIAEIAPVDCASLYPKP